MIKINKQRLNEFMKFRRWNRTGLAQALGFSEAYITLLLNEDREPSREFMDRLSTISGLSLGELFFCFNHPQNVAKLSTKSQKSDVNGQQSQENQL